MILHLRKGNELVAFDGGLRQHVSGEHLASPGHLVHPCRRLTSNDVLDSVFVQGRKSRRRLGRIGAVIHSVVAHVGANDLGTRSLAQKTQNGAYDLVTNQLLPYRLVAN